MKVSPKDTPKVLLLIIGIGVALIFIVTTLLNQPKDTKTVAKAAPDTNNIVAGSPTPSAEVEPQGGEQIYAEQIEAWSRPAGPAAGNPFREVLPREHGSSQRSAPPREISGNSLGGNSAVNPMNGGLPSAMVNFPVITVEGVVVNQITGAPTGFATLKVDDQTVFAKVGDVISNDMVVEKVTQLGVTIRAAKEHAFIEVSKSYKPNGMAPPAPPKPAAAKRTRSRHSR